MIDKGIKLSSLVAIKDQLVGLDVEGQVWQLDSEEQVWKMLPMTTNILKSEPKDCKAIWKK